MSGGHIWMKKKRKEKENGLAKEEERRKKEPSGYERVSEQS